jgi:hypothetical protein
MLPTTALLALTTPTELECSSFAHIHQLEERSGRSLYHGVCTTPDSHEVEVSLLGAADVAAPGKHVRLSVDGGGRIVSARGGRRLHLDFVADQSAPISQQRLLTIVCLYANASMTTGTASEAYWRQDTFGANASVDFAYRESSYGRVGFSEAHSRYATATLAYAAPSGCASSTERTACKLAAEADDATLDVSVYDHVEFWMPREFECSWAGLATSCMSSPSALGNSPRHDASRTPGPWPVRAL